MCFYICSSSCEVSGGPRTIDANLKVNIYKIGFDNACKEKYS